MVHKEILESFYRRRKYVECEDIVTFDRDQRDASYSDVYRQHEMNRSSGQYELIYTPYHGIEESGMNALDDYPKLDEIIRRGGVIAGSFPLYLLIGTEFDDIDIFVTSKEDFYSIKEYIESFDHQMMMYKHSIKFKVRDIKFNLIARIYRCQEEIIYGFDLPASQIMFDGKSLVYTPLFEYCIRKRYMEVDGNRLSPTYFQRLNKYWKRGVIKTIYFPEYEFIRERLIELPIYHQAWFLKDIPSRTEGFATPRFGSEYEGTINYMTNHEFNIIHRNGARRIHSYKGMNFVMYGVQDEHSRYSYEHAFELEFIESDPGAQVNSTIFPTPITSSSEWKRWIDKEIEMVFTEKNAGSVTSYDAEAGDAYEAYLQAKYHGTSPELEDVIATDADASYQYAKYVIKGRFIKGEAAIRTVGKISAIYDRDIRLKHDPYASIADTIREKIHTLPKNPSDLKLKHWYAIKTRPDLIVNYATHAGIRLRELEYLLLSPRWAYLYAIAVIKDRWEEAEKVIVTDAHFAYVYARDLIKGRWPEAEKIIASDPEYAHYYARDIIKGRWIEGEPIILTDRYRAYWYVEDVIKGRWIEAEHLFPQHSRYHVFVITADPECAYLHARDVIKGRWSEGERIILTSAKYAYLYAKDVIKGRWSEGESIILASPEYAHLYMEDVIIATDPFGAYKYARDVIKGRWSEGEHIILTSPWCAYLYAWHVIRGRWSEGESIILTSLWYAYLYAKDVIKGRWIEAEPIILTSPWYAYLYAKDVIKGRWSEGESIILTSPKYARLYAEDVIKGEWPEGESTLTECNICYDRVADMVTTPCNHEFCIRCYDAWFQDHNSCPYCRQEI